MQDGSELLEYVRANPQEATEYDACLLDEHMPRVNGCDALRCLRDEATPQPGSATLQRVIAGELSGEDSDDVWRPTRL